MYDDCKRQLVDLHVFCGLLVEYRREVCVQLDPIPKTKLAKTVHYSKKCHQSH